MDYMEKIGREGPDEIPQAIAEELRKWMDGYYDAD